MKNKILPLSTNERQFDLNYFGLSIPSDYTGADLFNFKAGSYHNGHLKTKTKSKSKVKRI